MAEETTGVLSSPCKAKGLVLECLTDQPFRLILVERDIYDCNVLIVMGIVRCFYTFVKVFLRRCVKI